MKPKGCGAQIAYAAAIFAALLLLGCKCDGDYIVRNKFVNLYNPSFATYHYRAGCTWETTMDSSNKFNVGDDIRKYKKP